MDRDGRGRFCFCRVQRSRNGRLTLLSETYHVLQIVYDGHGTTEEDFVSVEKTVDELTDWLHTHGISHLEAAYGCSLGGACLTRFLALGEITVDRAIIDAGITPYQMPLWLRRLACARDWLGFRLVAGNRRILEAVYPPERWTLPGRDPVKEYDALSAYLQHYSSRTVRNIFWSANNYALPPEPCKSDCRIVYWYGEKEKKGAAWEYPLYYTVFSEAPDACHSENGARGAGDAASAGVLSIYKSVFES